MTIPLVTTLINLMVELLYQILTTLTMISILFAVLHRLGVIQRAIHRVGERIVSVELLNGAPVTLSKLEVDFIRGTICATDGVIHSPDRDKWKWDSPLIARIGKVYAQVSILSLLDPIAQFVGYKWREIYSVEVRDVQVFVEKRRNVYNFNLLDESLDIPDPMEIMDALSSNSQPENGEGQRVQKTGDSSVESHPSNRRLEMILSGDVSSSEEASSSRSSFSPSSDDEISSSCVDRGVSSFDNAPSKSSSSLLCEEDQAEKKANEIVSSMLKTVSKLGKAAKDGDKKKMEGAFNYQRDAIVSQLKKFQENVGKQRTIEAANAAAADGDPGAAQRGKSMEMIATESMRVIKQMGKAVEKNVAEIQQSLKPPGRRKDYVGDDDVLRIGYIVFKDVRVFTKDIILSTTSGGSPGNKDGGDSGRRRRTRRSFSSASSSTSQWSKPILLKEIAFGAPDLSAGTNVRDDHGMPLIGLRADRIVDILAKRAIAEMAKTNTGRLFNNAFGEVLNWMDGRGKSAAAAKP